MINYLFLGFLVCFFFLGFLLETFFPFAICASLVGRWTTAGAELRRRRPALKIVGGGPTSLHDGHISRILKRVSWVS